MVIGVSPLITDMNWEVQATSPSPDSTVTVHDAIPETTSAAIALE